MTDKKRAGLDWEDVRVFIALARHGSLSAAARALSLNHGTISRRVRMLEEEIGQRLVERRPDGYVLTPAGTRVLASASDMEAAAAVLVRGGEDDGPRGLVRITAPPSLTQSFIVARLARLNARHPGLDIDISSDVRNVSLERREADIALRFGRPLDGDVLARPLGGIGFGFYGTEDRCRRISAGEPPVLVGFDESNAVLPEAAWLTRHYPKARMSFRASNQLTQAEAAKADAGIALLPHFIGRADPDLHRCTLDAAPPVRDLWLITRQKDRKTVSIRTVVDYLVHIFAEESALFSDEA